VIRIGDKIVDIETNQKGEVIELHNDILVYKSKGKEFTQFVNQCLKSLIKVTPEIPQKKVGKKLDPIDHILSNSLDSPIFYEGVTFVNETPTQIKTKKEGNKMFNMKKLFGEFGKVQNNDIALTYGGNVAIKRSADEYVSYNTEKEQVENHMGMIFEASSGMMFILPVTTVEINDVIKVKNTFYQVLKINDNGSLHAVNLNTGTKSNICKETNVFGFNFYSKVVSIFADGANTTGAGINPMVLMLLADDGDNEMNDMLPLLLMSQSGLGGIAGTSPINPLMLMMMMGDKGGKGDMKDMLLMSTLMENAGDDATGFGAINPLMFMLMSK